MWEHLIIITIYPEYTATLIIETGKTGKTIYPEYTATLIIVTGKTGKTMFASYFIEYKALPW